MKISLRDYTLADIDRLVLLANNENVSRYLVDTFPFPYTVQDARWWIETGAGECGTITRVIVCDDEFVGSVGLMPATGWRAHVAEIGYWVAEPYWGRGIATAALREMTEYAFRELGCEKLVAPVLVPNVASMRVLAKCGYRSEGCMVQEVRKGRRIWDVQRYAKLRD